MIESYQAIESLIESVRRRRRRIRLARLALPLFIVIAAALSAAALLPSLQGAARMALRAALLCSMSLAAMAALVLAVVRRENLEAAALAIERANPWVNNALISAIQLVRAAAATGPAGAFSRALLDKHLESAAAMLPRLDLENSAPTQKLKVPAMVFSAVALAFLAMLSLRPERTRSGLAALLTEQWSMAADQAKTASLPLTTGDFTLHYTFPAYSGISAQTVAHTNGDIAALKGTAVTLETTALEPLSSASIITSTGARYAMSVAGGSALKAELVLSDPGTYYIEGVGAGGMRLAEPRSHHIVVDPDLDPLITMLTPVQDVEVAAEGSLPISYEAGDDFGLSEVALIYQQGGEDHKVIIRTEKESPRNRLQGDYEWLISEMGFKEGQRIPFYLQATDNDEVAGGKTGKSEMRVLEIFSARGQHRKLLARQDEFFNQMIDHLASHIGAALKDQPAADLAAGEKGLIEEGHKLLSSITDLQLALLDDEYADQLVLDTLLDMARRYSARLGEREKLLEDPARSAPDWAASVKSLRATYQGGLEKDILYFDKLIKKQRVEDLMAQADDLYQAQADLADLVAEYKKTGDPALLEKLRQTMSQLQEAFDNLMRRMAEMKKDLPEEFVNADAMKKASAMNVADQMEKLRKALADGDLDSAMAMAEQFLSQMGQWMAGMEEGASQFGQMMSGEDMQKLSEMSTQLDDLVKRQQEIEDGMRDIYQEALDRAQPKEPDGQAALGLDEKIQRMNDELLRAQSSLRRMTPSADGAKPTLNSINEKRNRAAIPYSYVRRGLSDLRGAMREADLNQALEQAEKIKEDLEQANRDATKFVQDENPGPKQARDEFEKASASSSRLMDEIQKDLENMDQAAAVRPDQSERGQLDELSRLQEAVRQDTQSVREGYDQLRQQVPSLPQDISGSLDQAALNMHDASGEMMLGDPARAQVPARDARMNLEQARKGLQQSMQQMAQSMMGSAARMGGGMPMGRGPGGRANDGEGGMLSGGKVQLPDEGAYQVPEQYREEILRAMKEDSPDAYKSLNHDYYERLVR
ncbi:MAG TPA: DUF4175 family protein [bacterium]|nr:DUF4175 family protein [bacterium]